MISKKFITYFLISGIVGLSVSNLYKSNLMHELKSVGLALIGILIGFIISAYGIILGNLNNFIEFIINDESLSAEQKQKINSLISFPMNEIKENILFTIKTLAASFLLILFQGIDLPFVQWPFKFSILAKEKVIEAALLSFLFLSFWAIYDSLRAMFILYDHYKLVQAQRLTNTPKKLLEYDFKGTSKNSRKNKRK